MMMKLIETKNARLVCLGDSLTEHGWWFLQGVKTLNSYFPSLRLRVFNCGIGGDTMHSAIRRIEWDLMPLRPTHVLIHFGANDSGYYRYIRGTDLTEVIRGRRAIYERYDKGLCDLLNELIRRGLTPIVASPMPLYDNGEGNIDHTAVNEVLEEFTAICRRRAKEYDVEYLDFFHCMNALTDSFQENALDSVYASDHLHLQKDGYRMMGICFAFCAGASVPLPIRTEELHSLYGELDERFERLHICNQYLRSAKHFQYDALLNGWLDKSDDELIRYGFEKFDTADSAAWRKDMIRQYAIWRDHYDILYRQIDDATEKCFL